MDRQKAYRAAGLSKAPQALAWLSGRLRSIGIILTVIAVAASCLVIEPVEAGQKKSPKTIKKVQRHKPRPKRKSTAYKPIVARPPVLDTACIDTAGIVQRIITTEINRWSSARYKRGGMSLRGIDCSGFTYKVFRNALNYSLPRTSRAQAGIGEEIEKDDLAFGDLLFFYNKTKGKRKRISHVGIYIAEGKFVHSYRRHGVGMNSLDDSYYAKHFAFAKRVEALASAASPDED